MKDLLVVDNIESSEKESFVSSLNIVTNEEGDTDGCSNETNCVFFAGQIFLNEKEALIQVKGVFSLM